MNTDKLLSQYPKLEQAARIQYSIDIHNHLVAIHVCYWVWGVCAIALIGAIIGHIVTKRYDTWPVAVYFVVTMIVIVSAIVFIVNDYGLWWMLHNPTLALWQEVLPQS